MHQIYPATYSDKFGEETIEIFSDGSILRFQLRGIDFEGRNFSSLKPSVDAEAGNAQFEWKHDQFLGNYSLAIHFPVKLSETFSKGTLSIIAKYEIHPADYNEFSIHDIWLKVNGRAIASQSFTADFEGLIIAVQKKMPVGMKLECCLSCRWSHYPPSGTEEFGDLLCFRNCKKEAVWVEDKSALLDLIQNGFEKGLLVMTQETWHCDDFTEIKTGNWCYKDWEYSILRTN